MAFIKNLFLLCISVLFAFAIGEVASRYIAPLSVGPVILDSAGNPLKISYVEPDTTFRLKTPDYDAEITITRDGYRGPEAKGNPDEIFIGDSFTYAVGVTNEQTFSAAYCKEKGLSCANLAVSGASTLYEIDRLETYLKEKNWKPKKVHLFFFTGNDFTDNVWADGNRSRGDHYDPDTLNLPHHQTDGAIKIIDIGLKYSNLIRVAYFQILPLFRESADDTKQSLVKGLEVTKKEFARLDALSKTYGFQYKIYSFFHKYEVDEDLYQELGQKIQAQTEQPVQMFGDIFKENSDKYYFPTDLHLSVEGNKKIGLFLSNQ